MKFGSWELGVEVGSDQLLGVGWEWVGRWEFWEWELGVGVGLGVGINMNPYGEIYNLCKNAFSIHSRHEISAYEQGIQV